MEVGISICRPMNSCSYWLPLPQSLSEVTATALRLGTMNDRRRTRVKERWKNRLEEVRGGKRRNRNEVY